MICIKSVRRRKSSDLTVVSCAFLVLYQNQKHSLSAFWYCSLPLAPPLLTRGDRGASGSEPKFKTKKQKNQAVFFLFGFCVSGFFVVQDQDRQLTCTSFGFLVWTAMLQIPQQQQDKRQKTRAAASKTKIETHHRLYSFGFLVVCDPDAITIYGTVRSLDCLFYRLAADHP